MVKVCRLYCRNGFKVTIEHIKGNNYFLTDELSKLVKEDP